jgi:LPXTG-motif cell wall-anchored protein
MSDSDRKQRNIMMAAILVSAIVMRLMPHVPNFAPVTAAALFAAAYLPKRYALILPLIGVAIGDYLLLYVNPFGNPVFDFSHLQPLSALANETTAFVWGSFMISGLLGLFLRKKRNATRVGLISIVASLQFFAITNFAVWAAGAYARDLSGLAASYAAGLPFLRWTVLGDLFYVASFFGLYALALRVSKTQSKPALLGQATV